MSLFDKITLGNLVYKNRIVLSAMTRLRSDAKLGLASDLHKQYYEQRSGAGLLLTECSAVDKRGHGWPGSANIYTKQHADAWKPVVNAVKKKGSNIFIQLYHAGRNCHKSMNDEIENWAPSPIAIKGKLRGTQLPYDVPKEMTINDIKQVVEQFKNSAKLAKQAGFDGVHIHGAAGYIIDTFIRSGSNQRKDQYGGSAQNRSRFLLQIIDAVKQVYDSSRIFVKLSPVNRYGDMYDENPQQTYSTLLQLLDKKRIGAVQIVSEVGEPVLYGYKSAQQQFPNLLNYLRPYFSGIIIGNQGFTPETAKKAIADGVCDMISFAKLYINNPDLAERIQNGWPLNTEFHQQYVYGGGDKGYVDYKFHGTK